MSIFDKEIIKTVPLSEVAELKLSWWGTKVELERNRIYSDPRYPGDRDFDSRVNPSNQTSCEAIVVNRYPIEKYTFQLCELFIPSTIDSIKVSPADESEVINHPRLIMTFHDMLYEGSLFNVDEVLTPPNVGSREFGEYVTNTIARNIVNKVQKYNEVRIGYETGLKFTTPNKCLARIEILWEQWNDWILMSPTSNTIAYEHYPEEMWRGFHDRSAIYMPEKRYDVDPVHIYLDFEILLKNF